MSLNELETLVSIAEGFCQRHDIPEQFYRDLLKNQEDLYRMLQENSNSYENHEIWVKAVAVNRQIVACLNQRLNQSIRPQDEVISKVLDN